MGHRTPAIPQDHSHRTPPIPQDHRTPAIMVADTVVEILPPDSIRISVLSSMRVSVLDPKDGLEQCCCCRGPFWGIRITMVRLCVILLFTCSCFCLVPVSMGMSPLQMMKDFRMVTKSWAHGVIGYPGVIKKDT